MEDLSRREFLKMVNGGLAVVGLTAIGVPVLGYLYPPDTSETPAEPVLVGAAADVPVGQSRTVKFGRYPALVINTDQGLRAYSAVCTHFACIVKWDEKTNQIMCPCHEAFFDPVDGHVLAGPPPKGLMALPVSVASGQIYVGGAA